MASIEGWIDAIRAKAPNDPIGQLKALREGKQVIESAIQGIQYNIFAEIEADCHFQRKISANHIALIRALPESLAKQFQYNPEERG